MKEIKKDIRYNEVSADQYVEAERWGRPDWDSDRCGEIRIECDTVNITINCRD
ncbi:hypothetical protein KQI86_15840 [Clostridium sp. MSJ-11]|uniref:Uncharacterized protein n=1 Tax=Clostridium mobile TaxID=2841512 RepID=A0ABS6EKP9_9CLOT|nr:hypothetical protein [Clostridium mobile]MBU5485792.1 hypothetical protein [Clostridium mobile]